MPPALQRPTLRPAAPNRGRYRRLVTVWTEDFKALVARMRAEAEAAGELHPSGPRTLDLPDSTRHAVAEWIRSGGYEEAARRATAADPA